MLEDHIGYECLAYHYLDYLAPAESDAIHRHLGICSECRGRAQEVAEIVAALALVGDDHWTSPVRGGAAQTGTCGPGGLRHLSHRPVHRRSY